MQRKVPAILVVDDEPETVKYLRMNLAARGYQVLTAADGTEALKVFDERPVDLVLLDLTMPGIDGFQVCQRLRQTCDVPIVVLSARGRESDKVRALDLGADDYLTKPFGVEELLARVRAALRRVPSATGDGGQSYSFGEYQLDGSSRRLLRNGVEVNLTPTEFSLLSLLVRNAGKVLTHRTLLTSVWGSEYTNEEHYLWTYMRSLRRKLKDNAKAPTFIFTEPGVGYRFTEDVIETSKVP